MERFSKKIVIDVFFQISQLNSDMNIIDNTFIDTSTTTIEDMKRFIINCAKSGKRNIRIHNEHSPNLIFGKQGNFLITMNNDGNNVSCLAIDHWSATPIPFSFSISTGLDNWHFVDLTDRMLICLPENTNGSTIFNPKNGFNVYSLVTNVNAPYEDSHGYFVMVIKNDYWVVQLWCDLYDAGEVFYRKCDISNNWTWSQFKKLTP